MGGLLRFVVAGLEFADHAVEVVGDLLVYLSDAVCPQLVALSIKARVRVRCWRSSGRNSCGGKVRAATSHESMPPSARRSR